MAQIRLKGILPRENLGLVSAIVGGASDSAAIPSFQGPAAASGVPRISDGTDTDTLTLDTSGLTGITAYDWRIVGGASQDTGPTLPGAGLGGQWVTCEVTCDQGVLLSPPIMVYATAMMGMSMDPKHLADDAAVVGLIPHRDVTHIAVADGNWSDPATWHVGSVPRNGAVVLIPHGRTVTYDWNDRHRLDRLRVDGTLTWSLTTSTQMLVETITVTRGASMIIGTASNRVPAQYSHRIVFSCRDYTADTLAETDLRASNFLTTRGWGRGLVVQGLIRVWGAEKVPWFDADPIEAGATSLTARKAPVGLAAGDTIVIGGTDADYVYNANADHSMVFQDEERVVTSVVGNVISWQEPLVHPHKNQLPGSTRTDLYPGVIVKGNKNVRFASEVTAPTWRRGHTAFMHMHAKVDVWGADFVDLGRTDKVINPVDGDAGIIDANGDFKRRNAADSPQTQSIALTPRANLQSRYPVHCHLLGDVPMGAAPVVAECGVIGSPGWGMVHHGGFMNFFNCTVLDYYGCGMVSEDGSETGAWADNCVMRTTYVAKYRDWIGRSVDLRQEVKNLEGNKGALGDTFSHGYAYGFRGRAMRTNRNKAVSTTWANAFWHRSTTGEPSNPGVAITAGTRDVPRAALDLKEITLPEKPANITKDAINYIDYPIVHHSDNEAVACLGGLFVTKNVHTQFHDANIKLKNLKCWGYRQYGASVEYVGVYILDGFDSVAGKYAYDTGQGTGVRYGANQHTVIVRNLRAEGNDYAVFGSGSDTTSTHVNYSLEDPRWGLVGLDDVDNANRLGFVLVPGTKPRAEVFYDDDDWYDGYDYGQDPGEDYPLEIAAFFSFNFSNSIVPRVDNTMGSKTDNISNAAKLTPKPSGDDIFPGNGSRCLDWLSARGYYIYEGRRVLKQTYIISDRLTGRPAKRTKLVRYTNTNSTAFTNNGPLSYTDTPVVQADKTGTCSVNGSVVVDLVSGASGGNGSFSLDTVDSISPQNGTVTFDGAAGTITYTPDPHFEGTDEFYTFVESAGQYATVRVDILVGTERAVVAPVRGTHFSVADHPDANTIGVTLMTPPDAGGRKIRLTEYSTDGGTTWRRLCHRWVQAVHKITVESDGTAISNGSYTLRLRYKTNWDYTASDASAGAAVTVS